MKGIVEMIPAQTVTRRGFLAGLAYLSSFGILQAGWFVGWPRNGTDNALASRLADYYVDKVSAKVVGLEYLRSVPEEARADRLVDLICSTNKQQFAEVDDQTLKDLLLVRQREEFTEDRIVTVRGWILSRTECRLCALAAVAQGEMPFQS
jgi:hypothetical protein